MPTTEQLSRAALLKAVRDLSEDTVVAAQFGGPQKQTWIGWLSEYDGPGFYRRKIRGRDARFIYNHLNSPAMIIWLADASGVDARLVRKAVRAIVKSDTMQAQAAAVRRVLPWELVAQNLRQSARLRQNRMHYVAYQNSDELGPYYRNAADRRSKESEFFTAKQFREETLNGMRIWVFEGSGSPKRYSLISRGIITRLTQEKRPSWYRKPDRKYGTRVRFKVDANCQPIGVTDFPWFQRLLRQQQSFRNGFNRIADTTIIASLERVANNNTKPNESFDRKSIQLRTDLDRIEKTVKKKTTRQALIAARLGQGQFRRDVERRWSGLCAVTGCGISAVFRASHIKPWSARTNRERLDPANGLLLAAHIDALFDCGLVSFADNGNMLVSDRVDAEERKRFRLPARLRRKPTKSEKQYLDYHRRYVFDRL